MKLIKLLFALFLLFTISSCSITEKMIVNENGTGKFSYEIDGSKLMSMMGNSLKGIVSQDSLQDSNKETATKKVIDSTFTFKEIFASKKDSITKLSPEEQAKIKKMERFSVRTIIDEEKEIMSYSMFTDFNSVSELQEVLSPMESMKSLSSTSGGLGMTPGSLQDNASTSFFYDGKTFKKTVSKLEKNKEEINEEVTVDEDDDYAKKAKQSLDMISSQSSYKIVYQFPKAVKNISFENALFSQDRKTITIEYSINDYMENPEKLNFEVVFE